MNCSEGSSPNRQATYATETVMDFNDRGGMLMTKHLLLGAVIGAVVGWLLASIGTGAIVGAVIAGGIHVGRVRGGSPGSGRTTNLHYACHW